jgi:hypothetical protein
VIQAAQPAILKMWEEGDRLISKESFNCPQEIMHEENVGRSYYQCNPHLWQCYWENRVTGRTPEITIDLFGQTFHLEALAEFDPILEISPEARFTKLFKREGPDLDLHYGYLVKVRVKEIPGLTQTILLADTCRDTYLPQRIYGYGKVKDQREEGFVWDNFNRHLFLDKFYVTNRQVNEWKILTGKSQELVADRNSGPSLLC